MFFNNGSFAQLGLEGTRKSPEGWSQSIKRMIRLHGVDAAQAAMFEDMPHNLEAPHALGMTTVLVRSEFNYDHPVQKTIRGWVEPPVHVHHVTFDLAGFLDELAVKLSDEGASE